MSVVIEHKKGEVNELKASLRNPAIDRDPEKKREAIKRVIAYMTLGIDVSKLFTEMIMVRRYTLWWGLVGLDGPVGFCWMGVRVLRLSGANRRLAPRIMS